MRASFYKAELYNEITFVRYQLYKMSVVEVKVKR